MPNVISCVIIGKIRTVGNIFNLDAWLEAELAVTNAQSYTIGSRTMTKANLTEIRKSIEYWQGKVTALENAAKYGGRNRAKRFVPRDL